MVRLSKIYTKTGDDGTTGLGNGDRTPKDDLRVEAYGTVDEANAAVGVAAVIAAMPPLAANSADRLAEVLRSLQHDLFDAGADLCTPVAPDEKPGGALRITAAQSQRLEKLIDRTKSSNDEAWDRSIDGLSAEISSCAPKNRRV